MAQAALEVARRAFEAFNLAFAEATSTSHLHGDWSRAREQQPPGYDRVRA